MTAPAPPLVVHEFSPATISGVNVYTDLTNRWHAKCQIRRGKQYERGQVQAGTMSTTYRNNDGYLTPSNGSSPYSPGVVLYAPWRVRAQYPQTANLLLGDLATSGETSPIVPGSIPSSLGVATDISGATLSIQNSTSAYQGNQVFQAAVPANASTGFYILKFLYIPVQATSAAAPATHYAWSTNIRCTTTGINPQAAASIKWYNAAGGVVSSNTGSTVTLTGSPTAGWTAVQVSAAVPSGAIIGTLAVALKGTSPASPWTYQQDGSQFEIGTAASAFTPPGTWYQMFNGSMERLLQAWDGEGTTDSSGNYTVARVTATDVLSSMGRQKLNYCYLEYLLALDPRWCFQLNEQSNGYTPPVIVTGPVPSITVGSTSMQWADTIGYLNPIYCYSAAWNYTNIQPGTTPGALSTNGGYTGTPGPVLQIASGWTSSGGTYYPYSAQLSIDGTNAGKVGPPQGGTGYSVVVAFSAAPQPSPAQYANPFMWCASQNTTYESGDWVGITIGQTGQVINYIGSGGSNWYCASGGNWIDQNWHLVCLTISASGTVMTQFLDNQAPVVNSSMTGAPNFASGRTYNNESIGAYPGPTQGWVGYLALVTEFSYPLTQAQFANLYNAWRSSFAGESSGARASRILNVAGIGVNTNIQGGATLMGPAGDWSSATAGLPFQGQSVLQLLQGAVDAEQGQHFADGSNTYNFTGRLFRAAAPTTGLTPTFGEEADGWLLGDPVRSVLGSTTIPQAEIPYLSGLQVGYDADQSYDIAQITAYDGLPPNAGTVAQTVTVEDAAVVAGPLGTLLYSQNLNIKTLAQTQAIAQWIVNNGVMEDERVASLKVRPTALTAVQQAAAYPILLGTEINTAVAVNRRPLGGAVLTLEQWIENLGIDLDPSVPDILFTYQMSPVSKSLG